MRLNVWGEPRLYALSWLIIAKEGIFCSSSFFGKKNSLTWTLMLNLYWVSFVEGTLLFLRNWSYAHQWRDNLVLIRYNKGEYMYAFYFEKIKAIQGWSSSYATMRCLKLNNLRVKTTPPKTQVGKVKIHGIERERKNVSTCCNFKLPFQ